MVDTSALMAVLLAEPDWKTFQSVLDTSEGTVIAAPTKLELMLVATGKLKDHGVPEARKLLTAQNIRVLDWTDDLAEIATASLLRYGKGRDPAALNFGDCMAYALAKAMDAPLLFKGDDFAKTDIKRAI